MAKARKWDTQETAFVEIEVKFRRHGYCLPAKVDCDPDDGHDEELEDNRDITEILIDGKKIAMQQLAGDIVNMVRLKNIRGCSWLDARIRVIDCLNEVIFQPVVDAWEE